MTMLDTLFQDSKYAVRSLRRTPGFTIATIVTLALGIGANTAIFTLLDGVMFKPLGVPNPGELFFLHETQTDGQSDLVGGTGPAARFSYPQFQRFEQTAGPGVPLAAMSRAGQFNGRLSETDPYEQVRAQLVSGRFFETFGVRAAAGRLINAADNLRIDAAPVAVVSQGFRQRRLGADASPIGRQIIINNVALTIVGVAEEFTGPWAEFSVDVWLPVAMQHALRYQQNFSSATAANWMEPWLPQEGITWLSIVGRSNAERAAQLKASFAPAHRVGLIERANVQENPAASDAMLKRGLELSSFARGFSGLRPQFSRALYVLMFLVSAVLLIACVNVANLVLARAASREQEIATRLSLGASRIRVVRQLLVENILLAVVAGAVGILAGRWMSDLLATIVARPAFPLDARVVAFASLLTGLTIVLCGITPAVRSTRAKVVESMRGHGRTVARNPARAMRGMLAVQMACSCLLVLGAVLFGKTFVNLAAIDPGFDRAHLVSISFNAGISGYQQADLPQLYDRLAERTRSVPGVEAAVVAGVGLAGGGRSTNDPRIEGYQPAAGEDVFVDYAAVGPRYFSSVGIRMQEGRELDEADLRTLRTLVVNEAFVRRYFGGRSPIGKRVWIDEAGSTIVGVARDARVISVTEAPVPMAFIPLSPAAPGRVIQARVSGDAAAVAGAIRNAINRAEPQLVVGPVLTVEGVIERSVVSQRLVAYLTTGFAAVALLLACVGLYGVTSYGVVRRKRDIGVRMALGARPLDVLRLVVGEGMRVVALGVAIGLVAALAAAQAVQALLFGISATDLSTYLMVVAALSGVALLACYVPARRASRGDPALALRAE